MDNSCIALPLAYKIKAYLEEMEVMDWKQRTLI